MSHEQVTETSSQTPREFYDRIMESAEQSQPFTALTFNGDAAGAYNFFIGYADHIAEGTDSQDTDATAIAQANIMYAAGYCISGTEKNGKNTSEQFTEVLGIWPKVFDAVRIQNEARTALEQN